MYNSLKSESFLSYVEKNDTADYQSKKEEIQKENTENRIILLLEKAGFTPEFDEKGNGTITVELIHPINERLFELLDNIFSKQEIYASIEGDHSLIRYLILKLKKHTNQRISITGLRLTNEK